MSVTAKIIHYPKDEAGIHEVFSNQIGPLLISHFEKETKRTGFTHGFSNPVAFFEAWQNQSILVVVGYDGDTPVGVLVAAGFTPYCLMRQRIVVDRWDARDDEVLSAMLGQVVSYAQITNAEELQILVPDGVELPPDRKHTSISKLMRLEV